MNQESKSVITDQHAPLNTTKRIKQHQPSLPTSKHESQILKPSPHPHTNNQAQDTKRTTLTTSTQTEPTNISAIPTTRSPATEPDQQPTHSRPQKSTQPRSRNRIQKFSISTTMSQRPRHRNALSTRNNYTHQTVERKTRPRLFVRLLYYAGKATLCRFTYVYCL